MRLLETSSLYLTEFFGEDIPPYAILSHTWGKDEVSFQGLQSGNFDGNSLGYNKIRKCCEMAAADGFSYAWVDTCCIDKTSSAELSEAINSMFRWYKNSDVCYVYLSDIGTNGPVPYRLTDSRWFTRGWTLQELIAPENVIFFNKIWEEIGTKSSLETGLIKITKIQGSILRGQKSLEEVSVARRMSWASERNTTRVEDIAYCLMGIFNVHMPLLYGEGERAFIRLQEEIMKSSDDQSIFAWKTSLSDSHGLLADNPSWFANSGDIVKCAQTMTHPGTPFSLTNRGININLPITSLPPSTYLTFNGSAWRAVLNCESEGLSFDNFPCGSLDHIAIYLLCQDFHPLDQFVRIRTDEFGIVSHREMKKEQLSSIFVRQERAAARIDKGWEAILQTQSDLCSTKILAAYPPDFIKIQGDGTIRLQKRGVGFGALAFGSYAGDAFMLVISFNETLPCIRGHICSYSGGSLEDMCESIESKSVKGIQIYRALATNSDRVEWQHPVAGWHVRLEIKPKIYNRRRAYMLELSWKKE